MERIDTYPTHEYEGLPLRAGKAYPFGATLVPGGVNFSVFSRHADACTLVLFEKDASKPFAEIPFPEEFRVGDVFAMTVFGLDPENLEYGYRMYGPFAPRQGQRFDPSQILLDPYARAVGGRDVWGETPDHRNPFQHRSRLALDDFDWEGDRPLNIPIEDLVIYEMHVRSFTRHPSSGARFPGTFAGIGEKIPYLKELGVNCVELMPVFEFDEFEYHDINPDTGERLYNYWGYSSVGFFALKTGYAFTGNMGMQSDEFKQLVKELHRNGIEVWLDVVFNHTAEGDERGPTISFRGLDNRIYYLLTPDGHYLNFSGTGNTLNCNHPVVRQMVLDALRYWASEYHIDGFRFDLASILGRNQQGEPIANPPLLEMLAHDPILARCKLIAEAWDAGGLYQVGTFPAFGRWAEWNGQYRDNLRQFIKGDLGQTGPMVQRLLGSPDLYWDRGPTASINFITAHDGFTLNDLFSYNEKHNWANGEGNRDGTNDNHSWNCGAEGPTDDPAINELRRRLMKNSIALLMVSLGTPMILMGDEIAHTRHGNNNAYCHDNELNWLNWETREANGEMFRFFQRMIAYRHAHPVLRRRHFLTGEDHVGSGLPDVSWHGLKAWEPDWSAESRVIAFMLDGRHAPGSTPDETIYVAMNMHWEDHPFELPALSGKRRWFVFCNTSRPAPHDIATPGDEWHLDTQQTLLVGARSVVVLTGR